MDVAFWKRLGQGEECLLLCCPKEGLVLDMTSLSHAE